MLAAATPPPPGAPALSLIVIEDSIDDYDLVVARLEAAFGAVRCVRVETRAALEAALRQGGWSAVLADHRLPGFSSVDALGLTRSLAPDLPFLIVSGAIGDELAVAAMHAGASDYVMKDKLGRLVPALSRAIGAAHAQIRRREAETALIESEARYRSLAANLPGMVFQLEADGERLTPLYASDGARRLFGLAPGDLVRDPGAWLARLRPEDARVLQARLRGHAGAEGEGRAGLWLELVAQSNPPGGEPSVRFIEISARGRRLPGARILWDGIATDITRQKTAEADLTRSREALRELAGHLERVRERERGELARELHDDVGSTLTGVKLQLAALKAQAAGNDALATRLADLDALVDGAVSAATRIMRDLRPPILDAGIVAALEWQARSFAQRTGIACRFHASAENVDLPPAQAIVAFRVCQEALTNIVKHARATAVEIALSASDGELALAIHDDGRGIVPADTARRGHFGLLGMHERALALDGSVAVRRRDDGPGTSVVLTVPLAAPAASAAERDPDAP